MMKKNSFFLYIYLDFSLFADICPRHRATCLPSGGLGHTTTHHHPPPLCQGPLARHVLLWVLLPPYSSKKVYWLIINVWQLLFLIFFLSISETTYNYKTTFFVCSTQKTNRKAKNRPFIVWVCVCFLSSLFSQKQLNLAWVNNYNNVRRGVCIYVRIIHFLHLPSWRYNNTKKEINKFSVTKKEEESFEHQSSLLFSSLLFSSL